MHSLGNRIGTAWPFRSKTITHWPTFFASPWAFCQPTIISQYWPRLLNLCRSRLHASKNHAKRLLLTVTNLHISFCWSTMCRWQWIMKFLNYAAVYAKFFNYHFAHSTCSYARECLDSRSYRQKYHIKIFISWRKPNVFVFPQTLEVRQKEKRHQQTRQGKFENKHYSLRQKSHGADFDETEWLIQVPSFRKWLTFMRVNETPV